MMFDEILKRMLDSIPETIDKRKGSIIYNALAPAALELDNAYKELKNVQKESFANTATGEYLTMRCAERGIYRKTATQAIRKAEFNKNISIGDRFGIDGVTFVCIELLGNNIAKLKCEQYAEIGNTVYGTLLPLRYIEGLTKAELVDVLIPGEDDEDDESLRKRYFDSLESEAFGGNISDYKIKTNSIAGVGGTKVYPAWNGGGTVKLVIIDSSYNKPSDLLLDLVQAAIDPITNTGQGVGIAPIGHKVTVFPVDEVVVNIISKITLASGYTWEDILPYITQTMKDYFTKLKQDWSYEDNIVVRISQIESAILKVTGVLDITETKLNNQSTNIILTPNQIPKLGTVVNQ
jgi:uncharacterized phage protein gp47/JayE